MLSTVDYEGKMQSLGAGQAAGIPAMVYASDLYAVNTALEDNPLPQSVLIDVSNMNNIGGQLDELDDLIRRNIPIICLTDTMNSFELDLLKQREFNIWRWDAASITEQLYDASAISMDQKVKFCAQQKINYIGRWGKALKVSDNEEIMKQSFSTSMTVAINTGDQIRIEVSAGKYKTLSFTDSKSGKQSTHYPRITSMK